MEGITKAERIHTGGNVWNDIVEFDDGSVVVNDSYTIWQFASRDDYENGAEPVSVYHLTDTDPR